MRIFVAGGAGYIGSVLVPALCEGGHEVRVMDRFFFGPTLAPHERLTLIRGDLRTLEGKHLEGCDAVVDLAGISNDPSCELEPELTREVNVGGGRRLVELARQAGARRYVYSSSCSVYGHGEGLGLTESSGRNPVSLYARAKVEVEDHLLASGRGLEPVVLRLATVFGLSPRMRFDLAVNVMTRNAYVARRIVVDGGGKQWRPFVHVRDVADAFARVLAADAKTVSGQVFNVGATAHNVQILNLAFRVRDAVPGTEVVHAPTDPDLRDYNVRFDKIEKTLAYSAGRTIEDGVREILGALKSGALDPDERRYYTLKQYAFLREAERAYRDLALDGRILSPAAR